MNEEIPLSLSELQDILRCDPDTLAGLVSIKDFPIFAGVVFWTDFELWRRTHLGLANLHSRTPEGRPLGVGHKEGGSVRKSDSRASSQSRVVQLRVVAESLLSRADNGK